MYAFIDTETTGFARGGVQPRIVSMAWMVAEDADRPRVFQRRVVRPEGFSVLAAAAAIHGITTERALAEGEAIRAVLADFARDRRTLNPRAIVAHNIGYDMPIVAAEFERLGSTDPCRGFPMLCTMLQCRKAWPGESAKLGDVHLRVFGDALHDAHDAGADVLACARIFFHLASTRGGAAAPARPEAVQAPAATADSDPEEHVDWSARVEAVLDWAVCKPSFDTGFVESLQDWMALGRDLTPGQKVALRNIVRKWSIPA